MTRHDAGTEVAPRHGAPSGTAVAVDRLVTSGLRRRPTTTDRLKGRPDADQGRTALV
ncbi:hypothetical protein [Streptomyces sp. NPDC003710]